MPRFIWTWHADDRWKERATYVGDRDGLLSSCTVASEGQLEKLARTCPRHRDEMRSGTDRVAYWVRKSRPERLWRVFILEPCGPDYRVITYWEVSFAEMSSKEWAPRPKRGHWKQMTRKERRALGDGGRAGPRGRRG